MHFNSHLYASCTLSCGYPRQCPICQTQVLRPSLNCSAELWDILQVMVLQAWQTLISLNSVSIAFNSPFICCQSVPNYKRSPVHWVYHRWVCRSMRVQHNWCHLLSCKALSLKTAAIVILCAGQSKTIKQVHVGWLCQILVESFVANHMTRHRSITGTQEPQVIFSKVANVDQNSAELVVLLGHLVGRQDHLILSVISGCELQMNWRHICNELGMGRGQKLLMVCFTANNIP